MTSSDVVRHTPERKMEGARWCIYAGVRIKKKKRNAVLLYVTKNANIVTP
jgi:hypothetical protein